MVKIEVILSVVVIVLMLFSIGMDYSDDKSSKNRDENLSIQLGELNSNVIQIIPLNPNIIINGFGESNFPGREIALYEKVGYLNCTKNSLVSIKDEEAYDRIFFFFKNEGKKTNNLRVKINCEPNSFILAICSASENTEIEAGNLVNIDGIINIKELDSIISEHISIFYQPEDQNRTCSIEYDSLELGKGQTKIIDIPIYPREEILSHGELFI